MPCEVKAEINSLPPSKALALSESQRLHCQTLSKPLAILLNKSVQCDIYTSKLKHAKIIPVFKNEDESDPSNCRPISHLSVYNRIFEKLSISDLNLLLVNLTYSLNLNTTLERTVLHSMHALIDIVSKIRVNFDKRLYSCEIFIYLKKASDTVDHDILLYKLKHYGI